MKTLFLAFLATSSSLWSCSQNITPSQLPSLVQNSLQAKFTGAQSIDWEKHGNLYEAEFEMAQVEHTVLLDATGHIISHKQDIASTELPAPVSMALKRDYPAFLMDDLEKVEKDGQMFYQVELENNNEEVHKVYTPNGALSNVTYWE
ncbi:PepSY-like domain-containing protein [Rufibacter latericius]|uniref:Putative beta-lactamase-inhibitor-like PepSY-like domain-containing protein n=1 Tax=Rufibacter latericius TaxID=2487040 RepID=A0A3M9MJH4_9BACT|nr:PepSY-like domain-containing protein [Rufibacter latericius]RNI25720.1 hypothetical protein EFB08_12770 [Rufibacter latericius]